MAAALGVPDVGRERGLFFCGVACMTATNHVELTAAITGYVRKFGPCSFDDLFAALVGYPATDKKVESFRLRLKRMAEDGTLQVTGFRDSRRWVIAGKPVPPRSFGYPAGTYCPPSPHAARPGSEDFLKLRSVGNRC